jgi:hypothetical protein
MESTRDIMKYVDIMVVDMDGYQRVRISHIQGYIMTKDKSDWISRDILTRYCFISQIDIPGFLISQGDQG